MMLSSAAVYVWFGKLAVLCRQLSVSALANRVTERIKVQLANHRHGVSIIFDIYQKCIILISITVFFSFSMKYVDLI